jgi:2-(1,2-epoxy-1,2-dihydrophenyl)acetyl-CoA isomerase
VERTVTLDVKDRIAAITLNRPRIMNAFNQQMIRELQDILDHIQANTEINVVILEGAGGNFSSGADLSARSQSLSAADLHNFMKSFGKWIQTIRELRQPVITKVRGLAVGGGANLALSGDFVVAAYQARFLQVFIHIGLIPDCGGTYFLPRLVGLAKARELAMLGEEINGEDAASIGLIYKACSDENLDHEVISLARKISEKSPVAMSLIKRGLDKSLDMSLDEVLAWEASKQTEMLQSAEHQRYLEWFLKARKSKA